jgi:RNA polymerase sigma factor (sigma-70 family)
VDPTDESQTDSELVAAWQNGVSVAGDRLLKRHHASIWRFFSNKVAVPPEDLVQQTFLACSESISHYEGRSSFRAFLFGIARNVLYRYLRDSNDRFDPLTSSMVSLESDSHSPMAYVAEREENRQMLRVLRSLPVETQILVELAYWENLSDRELSEFMAEPIGTIKSRLRKARAEIGQRLEHLSSSGESVDGDPGHRLLESWAAAIRGEGPLDDGSGRR